MIVQEYEQIIGRQLTEDELAALRGAYDAALESGVDPSHLKRLLSNTTIKLLSLAGAPSIGEIKRKRGFRGKGRGGKR